jgi:type 1 glutamine amidotransferase
VLRETIDWKEFTALPEEERKRQQAESDRLTENLLQFIRGGGGFVGIHAATDCLRDSDTYLEMIGGQFWQHPWNGDQMVAVRVEEPKHPLIRGIFSGDKFRVGDEIYQFREPFSRRNQKVLLSINIEKSDAPHLPLLREDRDYPVSWIREYGKGRVFYSSLGHRKETYGNSQILECWLRGLQFVLGDLPTDNTDG